MNATFFPNYNEKRKTRVFLSIMMQIFSFEKAFWAEMLLSINFKVQWKNDRNACRLSPLKILNFQCILDSFAIRHVCSQKLSFFVLFSFIFCFASLSSVWVRFWFWLWFWFQYAYSLCRWHFVSVSSFAVSTWLFYIESLWECDMNFTALTCHWNLVDSSMTSNSRCSAL